MKILFVYPDIEGVARYGARKFYHGLGYLSAVLKQAGHETALLYVQQETPREAFLAAVEDTGAQLVAFSTTTHQHPYAVAQARWLQEARSELTIVVGGVHATLVPEQVVAEGCFDAVCVGEGEAALLDLVERLEAGEDWADLPGWWLRRGNEVIRNPLRPLLQDLDSLPFADRELFAYDEILQANGGWVDMMGGRGCPYDCSYCCNPGLKARYRGLGKYVRLRSVENVLAEIAALCQRYPVRTINFQDDTFTLDRRWVLAFCTAYRGTCRLPFWINTRVERLDEEIVEALAAAGCQGVRIGVESGNEHLRQEILKKRMSNADILAAGRLLQKHGLDLYTCNMIGVPGETPAMIEETIELNRRLQPRDLQFSVFYPYPMTELYEVCRRGGYLQEGVSLPSYYGRQSVLRLPTLTAEELAMGYDRLEALRSELALKRRHPRRYRLRAFALWLVGGDPIRLERWLRPWRALRRLARRLNPPPAARRGEPPLNPAQGGG